MPTLHPVEDDLSTISDSEMNAPRFFYYLGKWPDDYAQAGWSPARVREDLAGRRWRGPIGQQSWPVHRLPDSGRAAAHDHRNCRRRGRVIHTLAHSLPFMGCE